MTLADDLDGQLAPGTIRVERGGVQAEVEVMEADRLGVRVQRVRVDGVPGDIRDRTARLPDTLERALGERLVPTEVAPELGGAVLRGPVDHGRFTQVDVGITGISLARPSLSPEGRQPTPWVMTREQLRRTVEGLESIVRPHSAADP